VNETIMSKRNRIGTAMAMLLVCAPAAALVAQDTTLAFADTSPPAAMPTTLVPLRPQYGAAQKTFFTHHDLIATGVAAAVTGVFMAYDEKIADWWQSPHVQGSESLHHTIDQMTRLNETPLTIAAVLTYGIGRLSHSKTTADVGLHWTEALIFTDVICQAIRGPLGRARPRVSQEDPFKFEFGAGFTKFENRAFPSLHSAVGFATAASLLGELQLRHPEATWYAAPVLYGFAMVPGLTRMYLNQHWTSDIVAGTLMGAMLGSKIVNYSHSHDRNFVDRVLLGMTVVPDGRGSTRLGLSFDY
jgi:hypothetical protein